MKSGHLNIGLVGPLPPPSGGMANQTLQLANLLRDEGHVVELIQVNSPYRPQWTAKLRGIRALFRLFQFIYRLWQTADRVQLFHVMANSGWSWHLFAAPAIWIAKLRGKPVIINYRGGEADDFLRKSIAWVKPSLDRADAIIVPSGFLVAVFRKYGVSTDVVPNIINLSRFSSDSSTKPSRFGNWPCILVARNLEPIYDNATAIKAIHIVKRTYPQVKLIIAGSGPERTVLEELVCRLDLETSVSFTGRVDNSDMAALYRQADVMVNPSLVDNAPNSVLEALASSVPVVSTNVGGVPYLVEHEKTALLVAPQNPEEMAAAVIALIDDPAKAGRLREAGMKLVQQYTWTNVRSLLMQTYQHTLTK